MLVQATIDFILITTSRKDYFLKSFYGKILPFDANILGLAHYDLFTMLRMHFYRNVRMFQIWIKLNINHLLDLCIRSNEYSFKEVMKLKA